MIGASQRMPGEIGQVMHITDGSVVTF